MPKVSSASPKIEPEMLPVSFNLGNFPSVQFNEFPQDYNTLGIHDFQLDTEKLKIRAVLTAIDPEFDPSDVALYHKTNNAVYSGSVFRTEDGISLYFGSGKTKNAYPITFENGIFSCGNATLQLQVIDQETTIKNLKVKDVPNSQFKLSSLVTVDEKPYFVTCTFQLRLSDLDSVEAYTRLSFLLQSGDIEGASEYLKAPGMGGGWAALKNVTTPFVLQKLQIPNPPLQFNVVGWEIIPPSEENPNYGEHVDLFLDPETPVPFVTDKELKYPRFNVTCLRCSNTTAAYKTLNNPEMAEVLRNHLKAGEGIKLAITGFGSDALNFSPKHVIGFGRVNPAVTQAIAKLYDQLDFPSRFNIVMEDDEVESFAELPEATGSTIPVTAQTVTEKELVENTEKAALRF